MASRAIEDLDPRLQPKCRQFLDQCQAAGVNTFITQTYRSNLEQDKDYAQGRTVSGKVVTNARAGQSPHNCIDVKGNPAARAFDFGIKISGGALDWDASDPLWKTAIEIGVGLGLVSGSTFCAIHDNPHFEMFGWKSLSPYIPENAPIS